MLEPEINLNELFGDNNMEMQSSTIYRALRGEGMRVTPLVGNKVNAEPQKLILPNHMVLSNLKKKATMKPGTASTERSVAKTAYVGKIFDLRGITSKEVGLKKSASKQLTRTESGSKELQTGPTLTKVVMEFKKRDVVTPVSATSTQRVPFTSTKLDKQVSRESLKEESLDKKPKLQKKPVAEKRAGRKTSLTNRDLSKLRISSSRARRTALHAPQRLSLYKHRRVKLSDKNNTDMKVGDFGRNTPEQQKTGLKIVPGSDQREKTRTMQLLPKGSAPNLPIGSRQRAPGSAQKSLAKSQKIQPAMSSAGIAPKVGPRKSVGRANSALASRQTDVKDPGLKKPWLPTSEAVESWNLFSPSSKVRRGRKKRIIKRKPITFEGTKSTASRKRRSGIEEDSDELSTEIDEEERRRQKQQEIRRKMEQKSVEFFNQFKYGEMLKKVIPKMRYNSEMRPEQPFDTRLSDVEVKIRLSRLDESATRINQLMPKWSAMLVTTREANRAEKIRNTLINAQHILDQKVDKAKEMLVKYVNMSGQTMTKEEMDEIQHHSELVQLDMNSLERMFAAHEKQLADELDEPTSISP